MLLLRAVLLELLVCFHVMGGAVLFRRVFPRESPWLAFIAPVLLVMAAANFIEHWVPLTWLGILLPFTSVGLLWAIFRPGYSWEGLRFPAILFLLVFTFAFFVKCLHPAITCNTEGVADMARVLDFCMGETLPPTDTWCPPYDHGGYYSFQHYGASLLKRYFSLDIGTGYNLSFTLLNTLNCLAGAGVVHVLSGRKKWLTVAVLLVLLSNFTGSMLYLIFTPGPNYPDTRLSVNIGDSWENPDAHNPFAWIYEPYKKIHPDYDRPELRLFTPTYDFYFPEYHANLGGAFMTLLALLVAYEAFRRERSNIPWIGLLTVPFFTLITAIWFLPVVGAVCLGALLLALACGRRPENPLHVLYGAGGVLLCLWPSVNTLISGNYPVDFHYTPYIQWTPLYEFLIQWWPIWIPWLLCCFYWRSLDPLSRYLHFLIPCVLLFVEVYTFSMRVLTVEKLWSAVFSIGLVTLVPLVFSRRDLISRYYTAFFLLACVGFFILNVQISLKDLYPMATLHLKGDTEFQNNPQFRRMLVVLRRLHHGNVLSGIGHFSYDEAPSLVGFSENRCFIAWYFQEYQCGHGGSQINGIDYLGEAERRNMEANAFYKGTLPDPLSFLHINDIGAVLIWPVDAISDERLAQIKTELGSEYYYFDCREGGLNNAGVFLRYARAPYVSSVPHP